jgi:hypothetical protein
VPCNLYIQYNFAEILGKPDDRPCDHLLQRAHLFHRFRGKCAHLAEDAQRADAWAAAESRDQSPSWPSAAGASPVSDGTHPGANHPWRPFHHDRRAGSVGLADGALFPVLAGAGQPRGHHPHCSPVQACPGAETVQTQDHGCCARQQCPAAAQNAVNILTRDIGYIHNTNIIIKPYKFRYSFTKY